MALYENLTANSTPGEIAAAYKEFTGLVGGDTQDAQTRAVDYLSGLGIDSSSIGQAYDQFLNPVAAPLSQAASPAPTAEQIANTPGMGMSFDIMGSSLDGFDFSKIDPEFFKGLENFKVKDEISDTFKSVFGRDPTSSELDNLRGTYGATIDPGEFERIVLGKRDLVAGYGQPSYQPVAPQYEVVTNELGEDVNKLVGYRDLVTGQLVDASLVEPSYDNEGGFYGYQVAIKPLDYSGGVIGNLTNQILGQNLTGHWSGEGYGSAQKSASDMAVLLASIGITDINQFGKVSTTADVAVTPVYGERLVVDPEYGEYMGRYVTHYVDQNGKVVDPSLVRPDLDSEGYYSGTYTAPVGTKEVFGNKETGVALDPRYAFANDNIFSGTFAGEGSTGYGVQFRADGTPVFYTQFMGSSNDLAQLMGDPIIGAIIQTAASYFGGPIGTAALNLAAGRDVDDVAKAALTSWVAGQVGSYVSGAESVVDTLGQTGANIAGNVAGSVATGGGEEGALQALIAGGMDLAIPEIQAMIPGYADLPPAGKTFVNNTIASTLQDGKLSTDELINAAVRAGTVAARSAANPSGGITNRVYDDTITQAGADAYLRAKEVGASDEDAMAAADAATGVQINPIDAGGPNLSTTTTYDPRANTVDTNFGDLQGAIENNAMADAVRADKLSMISQTPRFNDAYSQARELLGPNQTFEWNGKQYSTATAQERPDLAAPAVQPATDQSAAETARLAAQNTSLVAGNAPDQSAAETARLANLNAGLKSMEKTSFLGQIYKDLNEQFRLQGVAANDYLKNNPNSPITESVSTAFEAAGELSRNMAGIPLAFDNKPLADAIIKGGERLQEAGQSIGSGPQDTKNWKDTVDLIDKASGFEKLAVMAGRIMDGTSGLGRQVELELRQEIPALFLGGGLLKPTLIASGLIDTADTGGAAVVDAYDEAIKKGGTHQDGLLAGRKAGAAAAATEAVIQATLGKLADFSAGKLDNLISKGTTKIAGEGVVEGAQEAGASAAVDLALGNAIDINKALTQGVLGAAVGKGTATATSGVDAAQTDAANQTASTVGSAGATATDLGTVGATRPGSEMVTGADLGSIGSVTPAGDVVVGGASTLGDIGSTTGAQATVSAAEAQQTMADLGLNVSGESAVALATQINNATLAAGAGVDAAVASKVSAAINAGANANTAVTAAVDAAVAAGNNVTVASDANVTTITNATTNTTTSVDNRTGVATTVDANTNVITTVDAATNTTTVVDANTNTTSQTKVDGNTQTTVVSDPNTNTNTQTVVDTNTNTTTSTTVNTNTNTTTQTTISGNTQTTVLTDINTNTQTTVKVNTNTGKVIEEKETAVPNDWTPPVIKPPVVPSPVIPQAVSVTEEKPATPKLPDEFGAAARGGVGLPLGIGVDPASLRSKVTEGAIDPLARVKAAQAELERDVMMNQMDPRFLAVIQQRMNPQQQAGQIDDDIGALAKMLRGDSDEPANEGRYYSYGSEDSIDDILGGRAANYKAGGFVEPLKASGGSMALPLLAKSGGALGHYKGRENFKEGKHVAGEGDGQSDDIPAWLADGEFVFPADVVSALGNGSTKAGTDKLYEMMHSIRDRARSKGPKDLPPPALKSPLDYLKSSKRSAK